MFSYFLMAFINSFSIDATHSTGCGRIVNDNPHRDANSEMKIVYHEERPHLCLFAKCDMIAGTELRYDYGVPNLPWRKKEVCFLILILHLISVIIHALMQFRLENLQIFCSSIKNNQREVLSVFISFSKTVTAAYNLLIS